MSESAQLLAVVLLPTAAVCMGYKGIDAILKNQLILESRRYSIYLYGSDAWIGAIGAILLSAGLLLCTVLIGGYPRSVEFKRLQLVTYTCLISGFLVLPVANLFG